MKKNIKRITLIFLLVILCLIQFGCTAKSNETQSEDSEIESINEEAETKEEYKTIDMMVTPFKAAALGDIEIHDDHSEDSNLAGYVRKGDCFEVNELYKDETGVWCRISSKHWINNNESSLLEPVPQETEIHFINNVVTFTDESLSQDRLSPWYDRYLGYVPQQIEGLCGSDKCEFDNDGRVVKYTEDEFNWIEFTYDDSGKRSHVSSRYLGVENGSWDYTYDDQDRIVSEKYYDGFKELAYYFEYDENGNLKKITTDDPSLMEYHDTNVVAEYEYNGSIRFELVPTDYQKRSFHIYRYDSESKEIERFIAPDGDIRNPMPSYY